MRLSEEQIAMAKITYTKVVNDSFVLDLLDTIEALQQENEQLRATIDEIKGIVGYPGEETLKKHGLTDTLPNIVRYLHREWLEQTHRAGQRCIEKDIEIDRLKCEIEQLRAQVARMRKVVIDKTNKLKQIFEKMNYTGHAWMPLDEIDDFFASETKVDYHNPADVDKCYTCKVSIQNEELGLLLEQKDEALRKAREALEYYADVKRWGTVNLKYVPTPEVAKKALAEIEQIGGKEDGV